MKALLILPFLALQSCAIADKVIENTDLYCSKGYKMARGAARSVVTLTTGIHVLDACDAIGAGEGDGPEETAEQ